MPQNLNVGDLADSLSVARGQPMTIARAAAIEEIGKRQADALEIAIFDSLHNQISSARAQKYSQPGGPNETGMARRKFPMQALERESDPLNEILKLKAGELTRQFQQQQSRRGMVRNRQRPR